MDRVRVGVIGAGGVAQSRHLPRLTAIPEVDLRLVWSRDAEKARKVAAQFDIAGTADDWRDIAASPEVDAVVVATPPVLHLPATRAALEAGKHVLCQARMARNLGEAREMLQAARDAGLVTALYPPLPGLKGDRVMLRLLHRERFIGDIREVRVAGMALLDEGDTYGWQTDPDVTGVNTMTLGMWVEVLNRWVGPATSLLATGKVHRRRRWTADGATAQAVVPDSLAIAADLACGATASYHFSTSAAFAPDQSIEIYGSEGALVYTLFGDELRGATAGDDGLHSIEIPPQEVRTQSTDAEFIRAIREGTPVLPDFEEGLRYMEFSEAVAISLGTGAAVSLPPEPLMDAWGSSLG